MAANIKPKLRGALMGMMNDAAMPVALPDVPRKKLAKLVGILILETPLDTLANLATETELNEEIETWLRYRKAL